MSEHDRNTVNEDPDLLTDEELDAMAGGIVGRGQRFSSNSPVDIGAYEVQYLFYDGFEDGTTGTWSLVVP